MLKYLNEVEEMMGGNDLAQIRRMMRYQTETMEQHMEAYDKIKTNVMDMNKGAMDTLKSIQKHAPEFKELYTQQEKYNAEFETQLAVIEEERKNYKKEKGYC